MPRADLRGFTLLELLVALGILAAALAVTLPALTTTSSTEVRSAAHVVASALQRARNGAISRGRSAAVTIDVEARRLDLEGDPDRGLPEGVRLALYTARSEIESRDRGAIRFFPDGSSTGGRVTLGGERAVWLVDVDWLTGRIEAHQGTEADWSRRPDGLVQSGQ